MDIKFLVEQTVGVTVLFALATLAAWSLRKHPAAARHMVWWLAALAALLLPIASLLKPVGTPTMLVAPVRMEAVSVVVTGSGAANWSSTEALIAVWLAGFALMAARLLTGLYRSSRRRRASLACFLSVHRTDTQVRLSDQVTVPETFGARRPVILLPVEAAEWPAERIQVVLAHELVHIQRHDWLTQLCAQLAACLYWFHPLAWFALSQMRKERELACDDGVLRLGYKNSEYAQHLVDVARGVRAPSEALAPSVAMAARSQLETRVRAILNPTMNRGNVTTMMKIAAACCATAAILLLSSGNSSAASTSKVSGTISDISGALVPEATIVFTPAMRGGKMIATTSNASGEWGFSAVDAGDYTVEVKRPGFRVFQQKLTVPASAPLRLDVQLQMGTMQETVQVEGQSSRQPVQADGAPQRLRIGGNVQAAKLLHRVLPVYPEHLKAAGITGSVLLEAVISREGNVLNLQVVSPDVHPDLVTATLDAVRQWRYESTLLNGESVEIVTMITVNFTLAR